MNTIKTEEYILSNTIAGPRWLHIATAIRNACWVTGVSCKIEEEKSLLRVCVRYELRGPLEVVSAVEDGIQEAVEARQRRR